jgi:hypothetical protein
MLLHCQDWLGQNVGSTLPLLRHILVQLPHKTSRGPIGLILARQESLHFIL